MHRQLDPTPGDECGTTLIELMVAIALMSFVGLIFFSQLTSVQSVTVKQADRSQNNDSALRAIHELERQIRSANVLYDPSAAVSPLDAANGIIPRYNLRLYHQAHADVTSAPVINRCGQWRIFQERLEYREWSPQWSTDGYVTGWQTKAEDVANLTVSPHVPAFEVPVDSAQIKYGERLLNVSLVTSVNEDNGRPTVLQSSIAGRNAGFDFLSDVCDDIPPYP